MDCLILCPPHTPFAFIAEQMGYGRMVMFKGTLKEAGWYQPQVGTTKCSALCANNLLVRNQGNKIGNRSLASGSRF